MTIDWYLSYLDKKNMSKFTKSQIEFFLKNKMKVVILAGGFGTRLSEYTKDIPKPLVKINGLPNNSSHYETLCKIWI